MHTFKYLKCPEEKKKISFVLFFNLLFLTAAQLWRVWFGFFFFKSGKINPDVPTGLGPSLQTPGVGLSSNTHCQWNAFPRVLSPPPRWWGQRRRPRREELLPQGTPRASPRASLLRSGTAWWWWDCRPSPAPSAGAQTPPSRPSARETNTSGAALDTQFNSPFLPFSLVYVNKMCLAFCLFLLKIFSKVSHFLSQNILKNFIPFFSVCS